MKLESIECIVYYIFTCPISIRFLLYVLSTNIRTINTVIRKHRKEETSEKEIEMQSMLLSLAKAIIITITELEIYLMPEKELWVNPELTGNHSMLTMVGLYYALYFSLLRFCTLTDDISWLRSNRLGRIWPFED